MIRTIIGVVEIAILTALILATRCENYQDVFVAGNIYFADADCYARMTRVRMCAEKCGLVVRHHDFENFPQGTTPHTTAPLDYLILGLSLLLNPFTAYPLDFAGAFVSPLFAVIGGWFLWWWSRRMKLRYRWVLLLVFALSPILVQGTELGRPDHQSLIILLVTIGICAEWSLQSLQNAVTPNDAINRSRTARCALAWSIASGAAWAVAIWVSAYEPLVLFLIIMGTAFFAGRTLFARSRRVGWIVFAAIIAAALMIERRVPSFPMFQSNHGFQNWADTIGELAHVSLTNPVWLRWCGFLLIATPFLIWISLRTRPDDALSPSRAGFAGLLAVYIPLVATCLLTIWEARWAYYFVLIYAIALPALLAPIRSGVLVWVAFVFSVSPILRDWDEKLWPNEAQLVSRTERRIESAQIRELAMSLRSPEVHPFLAPWWLSPSIAYWSGQPGVAGSSHESIQGIRDSARFYVSENLQEARDILRKRRVAWVFAYDSERVTQNSAAILNEPAPPDPLCRVLDRTPSRAPRFLIFSAQNSTCKLYRVSIQQ